MKINDKIFLGVGNISKSQTLGKYYQDFSPALVHIEGEGYATMDKNGIPYLHYKDRKEYSVVMIIQYGLICYDLICDDINPKENKKKLLKCINWLDENKEKFKDSIVWRSNKNKQYGLPNGWISSMYQGQAISLYLRVYQLLNEEKYLNLAMQIFNYFKYDYNEGGVKRIDKNGFLWYEEYPTDPPSYVLNGFVYTIFGIFDFYRVTKNKEVLDLYNKCINTLSENIFKYDVWYWSVYDQSKKQLVSYYYQKNVHIPLMEILYELTSKPIFQKLAQKWKRNIENSLHLFIVKIMYRIQPRFKKITTKFKK